MVAVAQGTREDVSAALQEMKLPFPVLPDPERKSYELYGLTRGGLLAVAGPHVMKEALVVGRRWGVGGDLKASMSSRSDWRQLGGTFVIDGKGTIRSEHPARDAADMASMTTVLQELDDISSSHA